MTTFILYKYGHPFGTVTIDDEDAEWVGRYRWHECGGGYAARGVVLPDGRQRESYMHREILGLALGDPRTTHHVNEDKLDNRRVNLEICAGKSEANSRPHPRRDWAISQSSSAYWEQKESNQSPPPFLPGPSDGLRTRGV